MTQISTEWQEVQYVYVGYDSGGNHNVWWRMYARISAQSGSSTTVAVEGRLYISGSGWLYSGATTTSGGSVGSYSAWGIDVSGTYAAGQEHTLWSGSATTTGSSIGAGVRFYSSPWGWTGDNLYISDTLTFAQPTAPPTGLAVSNITPGVDSFTGTVSIASWGTGGSSADRYLELQCWTNGMVQPRRYNPVYTNNLSATITVDNNSKYTAASGPLTIVPNTTYTIGAYATNGGSSTGSQRIGDYTTLAKAPSIHVASKTATSVTFGYDTESDGGQYTKTLSYSLDNGTTWVDYATVATGSATSGTFTISGLTVGNTYTMLTKVTTTAGTTNGVTFTIDMNAGPTLYGSANNQAQKTQRLYGSVGGQTVAINKLYASVNGEAKRIY